MKFIAWERKSNCFLVMSGMPENEILGMIRTLPTPTSINALPEDALTVINRTLTSRTLQLVMASDTFDGKYIVFQEPITTPILEIMDGIAYRVRDDSYNGIIEVYRNNKSLGVQL